MGLMYILICKLKRSCKCCKQYYYASWDLTKIIIEEYYMPKNIEYLLPKKGTMQYYFVIQHIFMVMEFNTIEYPNKKKENYDRMNPRTNALCEILVDDELVNIYQKVV